VDATDTGEDAQLAAAHPSGDGTFALARLELPLAASFSPSFAPTGDAILFHAEEGAASRLMEAELGPGASVGKVVSLVADGSRNFHVRMSPSGQQIAFDSDRDGERGVYVADADGTHITRVSGPGYAAVPTWSPDGEYLALVRSEPGRPNVWNLWSLHLQSGQLTRLSSHRSGQVWAGAWFPDGHRICYSHDDELIIIQTETGGAKRFPSPKAGRLARTPAVSPDGTRIAFQVYRDGVWILNVSDGSMRRVLPDPSAEEFAWSRDGRRLAFHSRRDGIWGLWMLTISEHF
jgi:Tol biopolymer transport system component